MNCKNVRRQIDLITDFHPDGKELRALQPHLANCASCRVHLNQAQALHQILRPQPQPEFPLWLHHQIIAQAASHDRKRLFIKHRRQLQLVPAMLALILSLTIGALIGKVAYGTVNPFPQSNTVAANSSDDATQLASFGESSLLDDIYSSGGSNE